MRTRSSKCSTTTPGGRPRRSKTRANPDGAETSPDENATRSLRLVLSFFSDAQEEIRYLRMQKHTIATRVCRVAMQVHWDAKNQRKSEKHMQELCEISEKINQMSSTIDVLMEKSLEIGNIIEEMDRAGLVVDNAAKTVTPEEEEEILEAFHVIPILPTVRANHFPRVDEIEYVPVIEESEKDHNL